MLWLVLLVCASPIIASYFTYYVIKPEKRNNYGTLIDQRAHPIPAMATTTLDGKPAALEQFKGKWVMLMAAPGACNEACHKQLFAMRQLRTMQGKEMDRIERVWLITDREPLDTMVIREYDGTHMLRADAQAIANWLPVDPGTSVSDHIYMIDPLGHLMMRFPKDPEPRKVHKDIYKLLKASSVG
ncbi:redoxin domain-containing protein [Massilia norwichensis]|uniref:Redoxin domain-containing protein n=1 Tax=Massilia norwichensis TaxID=1442366 RepID=A0ABT2A465_9BURK|nr:redoxin domain-containing protein [Massilia norwichensis]MCS0588986.1 redoxin domain-containing protein [Massilia norwichensis]